MAVALEQQHRYYWNRKKFGADPMMRSRVAHRNLVVGRSLAVVAKQIDVGRMIGDAVKMGGVTNSGVVVVVVVVVVG